MIEQKIGTINAPKEKISETPMIWWT